jgi:anti-sigma factor RsiW
MKADTSPTSTGPVSDEALHALVDGRLSAAERERLEQRLQDAPEALSRLSQWQAQRALLRDLHADVLDEMPPPALREVLHRAAERQRAAGSWWRWGGMAASVLLAFAAGWLAHLQWQGGAAGTALARAKADFVRQAALAHVVYTPEQRHPVEVGAAEEKHLVRWLSKRLGRPLKVPQLQEQGYALMGGRLLPGAEGARAQFMYQHSSGSRLTLYIGAVAEGKASAETAFRFTDSGPVPGFYWVDQGFGYALSGSLSRDELARLARLVYSQL